MPILAAGVAVVGSSLYLVVAQAALVRHAVEDGPIEWAGSLLYLAAGLIFGIVALKLRTRQWQATALYSVLALVFVVAFGEEISWGQRIFGWGTPAAIAEGNLQNETNFHNVSVFDCHYGCSGLLIQRDADGNIVFDLQRVFSVGLLGLLIFPPLLTRSSHRVRSISRRFWLPEGSMTLAGLAVAVLLLSRYGVSELGGNAWAARELMEAQWGALVAGLALLTLTDVRQRVQMAERTGGS